ncbi:MAG: class I SAM-dependent methyltransferase [Patescibacteria group bacterium]
MNNELAKELAQSVTDFYETYGASFSRTRRNLIWKEEEKAVTFIKPGMTVADIGAGNGRFARLLPKGVIYIGLEPSAKLRASAMPLLAKEGLGEVSPGDILDIPLPDHTADITVCFAVLHHIPTDKTRKEAVAELVRITKPGGLIIATAWHLTPSTAKLMTPVTEGDPGDMWVSWKADGVDTKRYVHIFTEQEWQDLWTGPHHNIEQLSTDRNSMAIVRVI